jgi:hypothetical protein
VAKAWHRGVVYGTAAKPVPYLGDRVLTQTLKPILFPIVYGTTGKPVPYLGDRVLTQTLKPSLFHIVYGATKVRALIQSPVLLQRLKPFWPEDCVHQGF